MAVEAVVYDIGNVLLRWQPEEYYDRVYGEDRRRALFAAVDLHAMNQRIDDGADFRGHVYETADATPDFAREIRDWHDAWLDIAQPVIHRSVALLHALKARGVPVYILSNIGDATFDVAAGAHDFLGAVDEAFVSGRLKVTKPDPAIYEALEQGTGRAPETLLFADDRQDNIDTARARGWQTHLFDGPEGWAARLVAEGLLTEAEAA